MLLNDLSITVGTLVMKLVHKKYPTLDTAIPTSHGIMKVKIQFIFCPFLAILNQAHQFLLVLVGFQNKKCISTPTIHMHSIACDEPQIEAEHKH